jgi:hypothetical protein
VSTIFIERVKIAIDTLRELNVRVDTLGVAWTPSQLEDIIGSLACEYGDELACPICKNLAGANTDGAVCEHRTTLGNVCPMSGQPYYLMLHRSGAPE